MEPSPIVEKSQECLGLLHDIGGEADYASWIEEMQMRTHLFSSKLGVFAAGSLSIDHRLRRNRTVTKAILQILDALLVNLRSLKHTSSSHDKSSSGQSTSSDIEVLTHYGEAPTLEHSDSDDDIEACSDDDIVFDQNTQEFLAARREDRIEKVSVLKQGISECIEDLLRYAALIRQHSSTKTKSRADHYSPPTSDDDGSSDIDGDDDDDGRKKHSLSAKFSAHIEYVLHRELGPQRYSDPSITYLKIRLRQSMLRRWRRNCYRRAHAEVLKARSNAMREVEPVVRDLTEVEALFAPVKANQLSSEHVQTTIQTPANAARSMISAATTLNSNFSLSRALERRTNTDKSVSRVGQTTLSLPSIPRCEKVGSEYIYDCLYCGRLPLTRTPLTDRSWKSHLWLDLVPYTCLYPDCQVPDVEYTTFHSWVDHTRSEHWQSAWVCPHCHDSRSIHRTEEGFLEHMDQHHAHDVHHAELSSVAKYSRLESLCLECVVCGSEQGIAGLGLEPSLPVGSEARQHNLRMCMANHLEALALSSLPWHFGVTDTLSSSQAEGSGFQHSHFDIGSGVPDSQELERTRSLKAVGLATIVLNATEHGGLDAGDMIKAWQEDTIQVPGAQVPRAGVEEEKSSAAKDVVEHFPPPAIQREETQIQIRRRALVLFDFQSQSMDQLRLHKGEIVDVIETGEDGWWRAIKDGRVGKFPSPHVRWAEESSDENNLEANREQTEIDTQPIEHVLQSDTDASRMTTDRSTPAHIAINNPQVRALYDFEPREPGALAFRKGDIIDVIESAYKYWWNGSLRGNVGIFPFNYVAVLNDDDYLALDVPAPLFPQVRALFDFIPSEPGELAFQKDDIIDVSGSIYHGWWKGSLRGSVGVFPLKYTDGWNEGKAHTFTTTSLPTPDQDYIVHATK